jgi:integrase
MALEKITKSVVDRLDCNSIVWDRELKGFGVRRQSSEAKMFVLNYRTGGGARRQINIGRYGSPWTVETARKEALRLAGLVVSGQDPHETKAAQEAKASETLGAVINRYLIVAAERQRPRTYLETERALKTHWKAFHAVSVFDLRRRTLADHLDGIKSSSGPSAATRAWSCLNTCLAWAIRRGYELPGGNPATGLNPAPAPERDRVLTAAELKAIWSATGDGTDYSRIIRLLMLTGQRRNEWGWAEWIEIVGDELRLPKARVKNNQAHVVPLSALALAQLPPRGRSPYVFGNRGHKFGGWSREKADLDERSGVAGWVVHDLRRTVATLMAELKIAAPHVIEAALNHQSGHKAGVAGVYNRATYAAEVRDALARWADCVAALVGHTQAHAPH